MNNTYAMTASFEAKKNSQAAMITAGFAGLMILLMFLIKWSVQIIQIPITEESIQVELNLEDEIPAKVLGGGGGGGNPVEAPEKAGPAPTTPPDPGVKEDSRDPVTDDNDKEAPAVKKPSNPKPVEKVIENTSTLVKKEPKPVIETPAPPRPKATLPGRTTGGNSTGGNEANTYPRNGGSGNGNGVGNGPGNGGGTGGGNGGGNGPGSGTGNGPRRVSGNRVVINPKNMDAGENLKGKVFAEIKVSPDGIGSFVRAARGSRWTSGEAIDIIREWLRRNRFNKTADESVVVYEFNFIMGG